jgi:hypothetical protein
MTEIRVNFRIVLSLLVGTVFIALLLLVQNVTVTLKNKEAEIQRVDKDIEEYREFFKLNDKELSSADCVSLVLKCNGEPAIGVNPYGDGSYYVDTGMPACSYRFYTSDISEEKLYDIFPVNAKYKCAVQLDENGAVKYIFLKEVT